MAAAARASWRRGGCRCPPAPALHSFLHAALCCLVWALLCCCKANTACALRAPPVCHYTMQRGLPCALVAACVRSPAPIRLHLPHPARRLLAPHTIETRPPIIIMPRHGMLATCVAAMALVCATPGATVRLLRSC